MGIEIARNDGPKSVTPYQSDANFSLPVALMRNVAEAKRILQTTNEQREVPRRLAETLSPVLVDLGVLTPHHKVPVDRTLLTSAILVRPLYLEFMKDCGIDPDELKRLLPAYTMEHVRDQKLSEVQRLQVARFIGATRGVVAAFANSLLSESASGDEEGNPSQVKPITGIDLITLGVLHRESPIPFPHVVQNAFRRVETTDNPALTALLNNRAEFFMKKPDPAPAQSHPQHTYVQPRV